MERQKLEVLDEITCEEPLPPDEDEIALRIYYGRAGEQLFEIAKYYHADPEQIAQQSGVEGDVLQENTIFAILYFYLIFFQNPSIRFPNLLLF